MLRSYMAAPEEEKFIFMAKQVFLPLEKIS